MTRLSAGTRRWIGLGFVVAVVLLVGALPATAVPAFDLVINEIDYDQSGTDTAEFLEIKNVGATAVGLDGITVAMVNGNSGGTAFYRTFALPAVSLPAGDYFVLCANAANTPNCDLDVTPDIDLIQNGAPDAVALIASTTLIDAVSYEGDTGAPYTEGTGAGLLDDPGTGDMGISRCPDGADTNVNNADLVSVASTPGSTNACPGADLAPTVASTTPTNAATGVALDADVSIDFSEPVNVTGSWFTISCATSGEHTATASGGPAIFTLDPDTDFTSDEACTVTVLAASVTDQDTDDPPDNMAADYVFSFQTAAGAPVQGLVINEIDYDQPGTDAAEFIEIKNVGTTPVSLDGVTVNYINGTGGGAASYRTTALPNVTLAAGDYFVVCANAVNTVNCDLDVTPETDLIQNGAPDAMALSYGATILDAVSYEGDTGAPYTEGSGTGLVDTAAAGVVESISRCPDGTDTNQNATDFLRRTASPGSTNACPGIELAPVVSSTMPGNTATGVALDANVAITFNEPANVTGSWFTISCATSGSHTAVASGGPSVFTLNPDTNFFSNETCTITVIAANVTDQDADDPPDAMTANYTFSFQTTDVLVCGEPTTKIHAIQGSGLASPLVGAGVAIEGIVVGDFQDAISGLGGYYLEASPSDWDADPLTSEGIFVFTGAFGPDVDVGDVVRVRGSVAEFNGLTELNGVTGVLKCTSDNPLPTQVPVTLPFANADHPERYEGMLVQLPQTLVISEYFNYDRFGEIVLALPLPGETRPFTGTAIDEPGAAANARTAANTLSRITLDDLQSAQNPSVLPHPNGSPFSLANRFRGGDLVEGQVGVLGYSFGLYRILPTAPATYTVANARPAAPEPVGGSVRVAAMNTLNFFVTPDYNPSGNPLDNMCGPLNNMECRGWDFDQPLEFDRQRDKLLTALSGLDADVIGLNEMENSTGVEPLGSITTGLAGYDYVHTGTIGTDAIKVGLIFRPTSVTPVGAFKVLDSTVDPRFLDTKSRPALAQTFEVNATGARFTVVVNHLKSKGSACNDVGDPDAGDGQGNCSGTRTLAAQALVDWLATDPTGSGDPDFLIMGDLNSYAMEDPIDAIKAGPDDIADTGDDYTNLIAHFQGPFAYSYVFDGQAGYLDHALANASMFGQVTGAADWHINSDESDVLDYDTSFKPPEQEALYEPNAYRSSDHDPVVLGLDLTPPAQRIIEAVLAQVDTLLAGADKPDKGKLKDAKKALEKALDADLWVDPTHVDPHKGKKVFDRVEDAAKKLDDLVKSKKNNVPDSTLQALIDDLVSATSMLARTAIDEAIALGAPADKVAKAQAELAKGDAHAAAGDSTKAIHHYGSAWKKAQHAIAAA